MPCLLLASKLCVRLTVQRVACGKAVVALSLSECSGCVDCAGRKALKILRARVFDDHRRRLEEEHNAARQEKAGSGDRSEKACFCARCIRVALWCVSDL